MKKLLYLISKRIFYSPVTSLISVMIVSYTLYNLKNIDNETITVLIGAVVSLLASKDK